jgi:hypothetical protein
MWQTLDRICLPTDINICLFQGYNGKIPCKNIYNMEGSHGIYNFNFAFYPDITKGVSVNGNYLYIRLKFLSRGYMFRLIASHVWFLYFSSSYFKKFQCLVLCCSDIFRVNVKIKVGCEAGCYSVTRRCVVTMC